MCRKSRIKSERAAQLLEKLRQLPRLVIEGMLAERDPRWFTCDGAFIRDTGPMRLAVLCAFKMTMSVRGLDEMLCDFFPSDADIPSVSAYVQQSRKINLNFALEFLRRMNVALIFILDEAGIKLSNLRVYDGTDVNLHPDKKCKGTLCESRLEDGKSHNMMHVTTAMDPETGLFLTLFFQMQKDKDERAAMRRMMGRSDDDKQISIADRGFESLANIALFIEDRKLFILRGKDLYSNGIAAGLLENIRAQISDEDGSLMDEFDIDVSVKLTRCQCAWVKEDPSCKIVYPASFFPLLPNTSGNRQGKTVSKDEIVCYPLAFRLVRKKIADDTYEVLITNLDRQAYSADDLVEMYSTRWQTEIKYLELKRHVGAGVVHSKKYLGAAIEFVFHTVFCNVCHVAMMILQPLFDEKMGRRKKQYKIRFKKVISMMRKFMNPLEEKVPSFDFMIKQLCRSPVLVQENRSFKRHNCPGRYTGALHNAA